MSLRLIKHVLLLSPVHSSAAGDIPHLCPPKYLLHFLERSREGGLFTLKASKWTWRDWVLLPPLEQGVSGVQWCFVERETYLARRQCVYMKTACWWQLTAALQVLQKGKLHVLGWDILSWPALIQEVFFFFSNKSLRGKSLRFKKHQHKNTKWLWKQH